MILLRDILLLRSENQLLDYSDDEAYNFIIQISTGELHFEQIV
jgi:hypothetical protein